MKVCSACDETKDLSDFPPDLRRKDGRGAKCRECCDKTRLAFYAKYPEKEAARRASGAKCTQAWYQRNREAQAERSRWNAVKRKYGITKSEYEALLESQSGRCKICRTTEPGRKNWNFAVEHDHKTGKIRGLTCHPCNVGLGMFRDDPELLREAARYLEAVDG